MDEDAVLCCHAVQKLCSHTHLFLNIAKFLTVMLTDRDIDRLEIDAPCKNHVAGADGESLLWPTKN